MGAIETSEGRLWEVHAGVAGTFIQRGRSVELVSRLKDVLA
jgi:hypothetical protein